MASYKSFDDPVALMEMLAPSDEIIGTQGQSARDIAEKYVRMSGNFPSLIRNLKRGEETQKDRNVTQIFLRVRMRAQNLLDDLVVNL
jgi:hypothetical protein